MLYLNIQKGKEVMKTSDFQKGFEVTAGGTKRITKATKGRGRMLSNYILFHDSWFSGIRTEEEANAEGVDVGLLR